MNVIPLTQNIGVVNGLNIPYNWEYVQKLPIWQLMEDAYNNDLKRYAHRYVSAPPGLFQAELNKSDEIIEASKSITIPVAEGSTWPPAAKSYAFNGFTPDLVQDTVKGFKSLVSEHAPVTTVPTQMEYLKNTATPDNKTLEELYLRSVNKVLLKGRAPVLIDIMNGKPYFVPYEPVALVYWRTKNFATDDQYLKEAIVKDYIRNPNFDTIKNQGKEFFEVFYRHYLENGVYKVSRYVDDALYVDEDREKTTTPNYLGRTLDFIPIVVLGSEDNTPDVDPIPLIGIANCSVSIYNIDCQLSHAERSSAIPTMYVAGVEKEDAPTVTGANVCLTLPDPQSRVGYTETDTSAMSHMKKRQEDYYMQAQELGASLLGASKQGSESGEALRLRQASSTASLKDTVVNVGEGITSLLRMVGQWMNVSDLEAITFEPNKEFSTFALTANETVALVQSWQSNAISHSTLLENFRKAGMLKAGETVEEEMKTVAKPEEQYVESCGCKPIDAAMGSKQSSKGDINLDPAPSGAGLNNNL